MRIATEIIIDGTTVALVDGGISEAELCTELNHPANFPNAKPLLDHLKKLRGIDQVEFYKSKNSNSIVAACGWSGEPEFFMQLNRIKVFKL